MEQKRENTFHAVPDDFVSEQKPATFEQGPPPEPTSSNRIPLHDAITGICFHAEEPMKKVLLEALTAHQNRANKHL